LPFIFEKLGLAPTYFNFAPTQVEFQTKISWRI